MATITKLSLARRASRNRQTLNAVSDAIRAVTAKMQKAYETGHASKAIDLVDLTESLLAIADAIDSTN